jgi:hypothetical protein
MTNAAVYLFESDHAVVGTVGWGESWNGGGRHGRSSLAKVKTSNHLVLTIHFFRVPGNRQGVLKLTQLAESSSSAWFKLVN